MGEANTTENSNRNDLPAADGKTKFPSDLVDPAIKATKEYQLNYFRAMYNIHKASGGMFSPSRRMNWMENKKYAEGNQSTTKYTNWLTKLKNAENRPVGYLDLDWSIVSVIPKIRDVVLSVWEKMQYTVMVDAINPTASQERERARAEMESEMIVADFFKEMSAKAGIDLNSKMDFMPENVQELDLYMTNHFRLPSEALYEMAIMGVQFDSRWKESQKLIRENFFDLGCAGTCVDIDRQAQKPYMRATDPINQILMDFRGHDAAKMQRIGEIRQINIGRLKLEAGNQFTEEEYYNIAKTYCGRFNNPNEMLPYSDYVNVDAQYNMYRQYDNFDVYVMDMDYDSIDRYKLEHNDKFGVKNTYNRSFNEPVGKRKVEAEDGSIYTKEVVCKDIATVYTGKWIIGSEYIYDYGLLKNISREIFNPQQCYKRYKFYRVSNKSPLERAITFADSIQLTWLKMQNIKSRAIPKGISVEIGAFDNVFIDGKKMTAQELLQMAVQTGIIVWRRNSTMDDDGQDNAGPPIQETEGGLGKEFAELSASLMNDIAMIREVTGVNEIMASAAAPSPELLVGVQEQAFQSANNAIWPMISGALALEEVTMKDVLLKIQMIVKYTGSFKTFIPVLGQIGARYIEIGLEDSEAYIFNTRFVARPTQQAKAQILETAKAALQSSQDPSKGGIEFPDYLEILRMLEADCDLKLITMVLNQAIRRFKKQQQAMAEQNSKVQNEGLMQLEQTKAQAADQILKGQVMAKNAEYTHKINEDIRYLEAEHKLGLGRAVLDSDLTIDEETHKNNLQNSKSS